MKTYILSLLILLVMCACAEEKKRRFPSCGSSLPKTVRLDVPPGRYKQTGALIVNPLTLQILDSKVLIGKEGGTDEVEYSVTNIKRASATGY